MRSLLHGVLLLVLGSPRVLIHGRGIDLVGLVLVVRVLNERFLGGLCVVGGLVRRRFGDSTAHAAHDNGDSAEDAAKDSEEHVENDAGDLTLFDSATCSVCSAATLALVSGDHLGLAIDKAPCHTCVRDATLLIMAVVTSIAILLFVPVVVVAAVIVSVPFVVTPGGALLHKER